MDDSGSSSLDNLQTEEKIFLAARKVFIQKGFEGASTADIAKEAGVNKALLNYYYRSKENLFLKVLHKCVVELWEKSFSILAQPIDLFEKIKLFVNQTTETYLSDYQTLNFILYETSKWDNKMIDMFKDELENKFLPELDLFYKQVEEEIQKGTIKPVDPFSLLLDIISLVLLPITHGQIIIRLNTYQNITDHYTFLRNRTNNIINTILCQLKQDC